MMDNTRQLSSQERRMMIKELDTIVLTIDLPKFGLNAGDLGTVVLAHKHGGYEVEFVTLEGETIAVISLAPEQVRPAGIA
jgi:Domain of unknown function (DUF4926)